MTPSVLSWILSATSGLMLWMMGNKSVWGPRIGIVNQILWIGYVAWTRQWGLLPGVLIYTVIHIRNLRRFTCPNRASGS